MLRTSLPSISGAESTVQRFICMRDASGDIPVLPIWSNPGSFQAPDRRRIPSRSGRSRSSNGRPTLFELVSGAPRLAPVLGAHCPTLNCPFWRCRRRCRVRSRGALRPSSGTRRASPVQSDEASRPRTTGGRHSRRPIPRSCARLLLRRRSSFHAVAALVCGRCGETELQSLRMDEIAERFHIGEALVGMKHALCVARALPAVADLDIDIAQEIEPRLDQFFDGLPDRGVIGSRPELLPARPAHQRRRCEIVGREVAQHRQGHSHLRPRRCRCRLRYGKSGGR